MIPYNSINFSITYQRNSFTKCASGLRFALGKENKYDNTTDSIAARRHTHHKLGNVDPTEKGLPVGTRKKRNGTSEGLVPSIRDITARGTDTTTAFFRAAHSSAALARDSRTRDCTS